MLVGMRLHALIFASIMHVPTVGISYDPKIDNFLDSIHEEVACHISSFDVEKLYNKTCDLLKEPAGEYDWSAVEALRDRSQETIRLLKKLAIHRED